MNTIVLLHSTGNHRVDIIVRGVIGIMEHLFPDRIRAYYMRGSYAGETAGAASDIDMWIVFKNQFLDPSERKKAYDLCGYCALISVTPLEIIVASEQDLLKEEALAGALNLKRAARLVYGEDMRALLPTMDADTYIRSVIHTPYFNYRFPQGRRHLDALVFPLGHIDPEGLFYGYDQWLLPTPDGPDRPSTKLLVAHVSWTATAMVALRTGLYVGDKRACVRLYKEHIHDEWTDLVESVYEKCRNQWHYLVPEDEASRLMLRHWCDRALSFANYFLTLYRDYLLQELQSADRKRQLLAIKRLGQMIYPDQEVIDALSALVPVDELSKEARETLQRAQASFERSS